MNFYEMRMSRRFVERQLSQLTESIQALADALARPAGTITLPDQADSDFLEKLYRGNYEPAVFKPSAENRQITQAIRQAHITLSAGLSKSQQDALANLEAALSERSTIDAERAFEDGFRAAVQMMIAGLSAPDGEVSDS